MRVYRHVWGALTGAAIALAIAQPAAANTTAIVDVQLQRGDRQFSPPRTPPGTRLGVWLANQCLGMEIPLSSPTVAQSKSFSGLPPIDSSLRFELDSDQPVILKIVDKPIDEVLQILAEIAKLNVIFTTHVEAKQLEQRFSLEVQDESLEDIFNYILQVSGLKAIRQDQAILIANQSALHLQEIISPTFRINRVNAEQIVAHFENCGAQRIAQSDNDKKRIETDEFGFFTPDIISPSPDHDNNQYYPLKSLYVSSNPLWDSITLTGEPYKVGLALELTRVLDVPSHPVGVNIKILSVDRERLGRIGHSFGHLNELALERSTYDLINFNAQGYSLPESVEDAWDFITLIQHLLDNSTNNSVATLLDQNLAIPQGQIDTVKLVEEVITDVEIEREVGHNLTTLNIETETGEVGLLLSIKMGYVDHEESVPLITMEIDPTVLSVAEKVSYSEDRVTNTSNVIERQQLSSGTLRVYSDHTALLAGIFPLGEAFPASAQPIFSELPGLRLSLQRIAEFNRNRNREVVILVTPSLQVEIP
ncbi:MAG: hypothetical protein AAGG51_10755 [Cyanobacteria bacterium P01_G01_bin.54]